MAEHSIPVPDPSRQVRFHQLLVSARKTWLIDALTTALGEIDLGQLKEQVVQFVPAPALRTMACFGVRDEQVFPTPIVLEKAPTLVGYYRLLLGAPQKGVTVHPPARQTGAAERLAGC